MAPPDGDRGHGAASVLVMASTFPSQEDDPVPAFVRDQVRALAAHDPGLRLRVLAPHDHRSGTRPSVRHDDYDEMRFHYFWPRRAEVLAGRGIMPALQHNPWLYAVVPFLFLGEFRAALRETRRARPAVIYAHWFTPQAVVASWVARLTGVPFVFTTHASDVDVWTRVPVVGRWVVRRTLHHAAAASAVSTRTLARLRQFGTTPGTDTPVHVLPMGTDLPGDVQDPDLRARSRERLGVAHERVVLFMGRLVEKKGTRYLLEALHAANDQLSPWRLVVAGDGPLRTELERLARSLGIDDRVDFVGYTTGSDKESLYRAADVLVVPSVVAANRDVEGLPVVLLEGLSFGLPCVATHQSGADDIVVDGRTALLVEERDVAGLASALERVDALTDAEREALSLRAFELSREFAWASLAKRHYDLLIAPHLPRQRGVS